ncbi:unnamed protein product [Cylicocyclus nassatus]|uniref:Uncharacterized protein n=1 Tax=Cylicocyclus nassatus TaxID=53992 RepID=A0AA36HH67_CYLNA|nr:unnamed protein product [Cylicocyclus nassatus]
MSLRITPVDNTYRLMSYSEKRIAFQARIRGTLSYDVAPAKGFINCGDMVILKIRQKTVDNIIGKLIVDWVESNDEEDVTLVLQRRTSRCNHIICPFNSENVRNYFVEPFDPLGEERHPWLILKSGYETVAARNEDLICNTVANIVDELARFSLLLQKAPLYCCLSCALEKEVLDNIQDYIRSSRTKKIPVLFLVDDSDGELINFFKKKFSQGICLFELTGQQIIELDWKLCLSKCCLEFIKKLCDWESREDTIFEFQLGK